MIQIYFLRKVARCSDVWLWYCMGFTATLCWAIQMPRSGFVLKSTTFIQNWHIRFCRGWYTDVLLILAKTSCLTLRIKRFRVRNSSNIEYAQKHVLVFRGVPFLIRRLQALTILYMWYTCTECLSCIPWSHPVYAVRTPLGSTRKLSLSRENSCWVVFSF